jgi:hypothetical protein
MPTGQPSRVTIIFRCVPCSLVFVAANKCQGMVQKTYELGGERFEGERIANTHNAIVLSQSLSSNCLGMLNWVICNGG